MSREVGYPHGVSRRWTAPFALAPVRASVRVPGSKSVTNRALVLAALADGPSVLHRPLRSRDTMLMAAALRALGVGVDEDAAPASDPGDAGSAQGEQWVVSPAPLRGPTNVDCGLAGTVMRFVPPVAALGSGDVRFDGDPAARVRPMLTGIEALRSLGADVDDEGRGSLPFTVRARGSLRGGQVTLDASASSQFVSGLLLSAPRYEQGVLVRHEGPPVPSRPHLRMTLAMLADAGAHAGEAGPDCWQVSRGTLQPLNLLVEPDLSGAAPFLAAAVVTGGQVHVPGWPAETTQPGGDLPDLLEAMGGRVTRDASGLTLTGSGRVRGIDANLRDAGELTPVLAALAALADSPSHLRGIGHLRGHETDRLAALTRELGALGAGVRETADGLTIEPRPLHGGLFATYEDHRMAMAAAVVGLVTDGVVVDDVDVTSKTMPGFPEQWAAMLGHSA